MKESFILKIEKKDSKLSLKRGNLIIVENDDVFREIFLFCE